MHLPDLNISAVFIERYVSTNEERMEICKWLTFSCSEHFIGFVVALRCVGAADCVQQQEPNESDHQIRHFVFLVEFWLNWIGWKLVSFFLVILVLCFDDYLGHFSGWSTRIIKLIDLVAIASNSVQKSSSKLAPPYANYMQMRTWLLSRPGLAFDCTAYLFNTDGYFSV